MAQTNWERMTEAQKLTAATVDVMRHPEFALLSGIVMMGKAEVYHDVALMIITGNFPTAGTDGLNCYYGSSFMGAQNRKQWRWVVLHENFHKALHHCVDYVEIVTKYPRESNMAQDYVINATIDEIDPEQEFAQQPAGVKICLDKKYYGWSFIEVLRDLLKNPPPPQKKDGKGDKSKGQAGGAGSTDGQGDEPEQFDAHIQNPNAGQQTDAQKKELATIKQQVQDALHQGRMTVQRMAGQGKGNQALNNILAKRTTDWKTPLREFVEQICVGYEQSRFCPPNKRFLPQGILMPSHFAEATGELHVYCDTSGSMGGIYPVVFGEIARLAEQVKPSLLRVIWWDGEVQGEQVFKEGDYDTIATLMKPSGGGGTSPNCVVRYVAEKGYKPRAGIWLTDGYLDGGDAVMPWPVIWGVVDNTSFRPPQGKRLDIQSAL